MTLSGVGKCRQVGISESGIDDAVEKLVARGYKVGRIEQLETSDQAKARGPETTTDVAGNVLLVTIEGTYARLVSIDVLHLAHVNGISTMAA